MPKKVVRRIPIKPPAGIKHAKKMVLRPVAVKRMAVKRGGMIPLAIAAPILGALGAPLAGLAGREIAKGAEYGVKKLRKWLGIGVIRSGSSRFQGGRQKTVRRIVVRI